MGITNKVASIYLSSIIYFILFHDFLSVGHLSIYCNLNVLSSFSAWVGYVLSCCCDNLLLASSVSFPVATKFGSCCHSDKSGVSRGLISDGTLRAVLLKNSLVNAIHPHTLKILIMRL